MKKFLVLLFIVNCADEATDPSALLGQLVLQKNQFSVTGDAVLRNVSGIPTILNRGKDGSIHLLTNAPEDVVNLTPRPPKNRMVLVVTSDFESGTLDALIKGDSSASLISYTQQSLLGCNPYDAIRLDDSRIVITCYDTGTLRVLELSDNKVKETTSLANFDNDGVPQMDHMIQIKDRLYVSMAILDDGYIPKGTGIVAVLDAVTLELIDQDDNDAGIQGIKLPCKNPVTSLAKMGDSFAIGCANDYGLSSDAGIAVVTPKNGKVELSWVADVLEGVPLALLTDHKNEETLYTLINVPDTATGFPKEIRLVKIDKKNRIETLYSANGFNLSGLAQDEEGILYVGNRTPTVKPTDTSDAGVWLVNPDTGKIDGPALTTLPPYEIAAF